MPGFTLSKLWVDTPGAISFPTPKYQRQTKVATDVVGVTNTTVTINHHHFPDGQRIVIVRIRTDLDSICHPNNELKTRRPVENNREKRCGRMKYRQQRSCRQAER